MYIWMWTNEAVELKEADNLSLSCCWLETSFYTLGFDWKSSRKKKIYCMRCIYFYNVLFYRNWATDEFVLPFTNKNWLYLTVWSLTYVKLWSISTLDQITSSRNSLVSVWLMQYTNVISTVECDVQLMSAWRCRTLRQAGVHLLMSGRDSIPTSN